MKQIKEHNFGVRDFSHEKTLNIEVIGAVPFVFDIAHDQSVVEFNCPAWEFGFIGC
jgi:hypothetical protein